MTKISKNAAKEFKDELCVCYRDDQQEALITTKADAARHENDMNEYVCSSVDGNNPDLSQALGVRNIDNSDDYYGFLEQFQRLRRLTSKCKIGNGLSPRGRQTTENETTYTLNNTKHINDSIFMTNNDLKSVQQNSHVDLGLQDLVDVVKSLEKKNIK